MPFLRFDLSFIDPCRPRKRISYARDVRLHRVWPHQSAFETPPVSWHLFFSDSQRTLALSRLFCLHLALSDTRRLKRWFLLKPPYCIQIGPNSVHLAETEASLIRVSIIAPIVWRILLEFRFLTDLNFCVGTDIGILFENWESKSNNLVSLITLFKIVFV